jgi:hypothetical protein
MATKKRMTMMMTMTMMTITAARRPSPRRPCANRLKTTETTILAVPGWLFWRAA